MPARISFDLVRTYWKRPQVRFALGGVALVLVSCLLLFAAVRGVFRKPAQGATGVLTVPTSTEALVPRRLDGVLVPRGSDQQPPIAIMVENAVDARPLSGIAQASIVVEAPVEGGITRFFALYDASTTVSEVGPVRSARPYYVDWAYGWNALYMHVGGSPEALDKIAALGDAFHDWNEFFNGHSFWRAIFRGAPHNVYTKADLMKGAWQASGAASSTARVAWHFTDAASSTDRGDGGTVKIPYGGNYSVSWAYDKERNVYVRSIAGRAQKDSDGTPYEAENVVVLMTDAQVLDAVGRLKVRTTGKGDAVAYRDGRKFILHWSRSGMEPIRLEGTDGSEFEFVRGRTWIEITTDNRIFSGLGM